MFKKPLAFIPKTLDIQLLGPNPVGADYLKMQYEITEAILSSFAIPASLMTFTSTSTANYSASRCTLDSIVEAMKAIPRLPKPDPTHCCNCHEEMSKPAMDVMPANATAFSSPIGYLCGRCAYIAKQEYHYKPKQQRPS